MVKKEFPLWKGKISGYLSFALGGLSLGAVLCFQFPEALTTPMLRNVYPIDLVRRLLATTIGLSFFLGAVSFALDDTRRSGTTGMLLAMLATLLGGSEVPNRPVAVSNYMGLDWFILDILILALLFVPVERLWPRHRTQRVLRAGWKTDLSYFFVTHVLIQMTVLITMAPARMFFGWAASAPLRSFISAQPMWLQFLETVFVADFSQYWIHRAFHRFPFLWRFHAIHHSSRQMDWLMGSRLHLVDILVTRSLSFIPLYLLGFSGAALNAYLTFVAFHAVLIHANLRFELSPLRKVVVTPFFHHWHHGSEPEAIDKNFAVHLPLLDIVFGTSQIPDRWPAAYGIEGSSIPRGWLAQLWWPFRSHTEA